MGQFEILIKVNCGYIIPTAMKGKVSNIFWILVLIGFVIFLAWNAISGDDNRTPEQQQWEDQAGDGSRPWN